MYYIYKNGFAQDTKTLSICWLFIQISVLCKVFLKNYMNLDLWVHNKDLGYNISFKCIRTEAIQSFDTLFTSYTNHMIIWSYDLTPSDYFYELMWKARYIRIMSLLRYSPKSVKMLFKISTKEWTSVELWRSFGRYYFSYINITTDTPSINKKFSKTNANYVFYSFLKKCTIWNNLFIMLYRNNSNCEFMKACVW